MDTSKLKSNPATSLKLLLFFLASPLPSFPVVVAIVGFVIASVEGSVENEGNTDGILLCLVVCDDDDDDEEMKKKGNLE